MVLGAGTEWQRLCCDRRRGLASTLGAAVRRRSQLSLAHIFAPIRHVRTLSVWNTLRKPGKGSSSHKANDLPKEVHHLYLRERDNDQLYMGC